MHRWHHSEGEANHAWRVGINNATEKIEIRTATVLRSNDVTSQLVQHS